MRKEFIIFALVIVLLLAVVIVPGIIGRQSRIPTGRVQMYLSPDSSQIPSGMVWDDEFGWVEEGFDPYPMPEEPSFTPSVPVSREPVVTPSEPISIEPTDESDSGVDEPSDEVVDTGDTDISNDVPDLETYSFMVMYYVCGLYDEMFDIWMTQELRSEFGQHVTEEPYASLNGNIGFESVIMEPGHVSFKAKNGEVYSFDYTLEYGKIANILSI